jgi:hypothetical protein
MRRTVSFAFALAPFVAWACGAQPLDGRPTASTPDGGGIAAVSSVPATCITATASFKDGLRMDLSASVDPALRTSTYGVAVDGVTLTAGYGQDFGMLATGFSVGAAWIDDLTPDASATTLSFGGWGSTSSMRDALGFHAAEQLWTALAGATETRVGTGIVRTTQGRRAACRRDEAGGSVSIDCLLGGLLRVDAAESACPLAPSPSP